MSNNAIIAGHHPQSHAKVKCQRAPLDENAGSQPRFEAWITNLGPFAALCSAVKKALILCPRQEYILELNFFEAKESLLN
jgi:hypothetical protein